MRGLYFFFSSRRRHTRCALVTGVQTCALPILDKMSSFETLVPNTPAGRFDGIKRTFTAQDVEKLRGSVPIDYTLARRGALKLWELLKTEPYINALGALSGNQAMQLVRAGLKAISLDRKSVV